MTATLDNPLAAYVIRTYREEDRAGAETLGTGVIGWWHNKELEASLHLVAAEKATEVIVGHLQTVRAGTSGPRHAAVPRNGAVCSRTLREVGAGLSKA